MCIFVRKKFFFCHQNENLSYLYYVDPRNMLFYSRRLCTESTWNPFFDKFVSKIYTIIRWQRIFFLSPELEPEFHLLYRSWINVILFQIIVHKIHTKISFLGQKMHFVSKVYTIGQVFKPIKVWITTQFLIKTLGGHFEHV